MIETKLRTAPETMPEDIIGTVIFRKADRRGQPRLSAASSIVIGIFIMAAVADRLVNGIRRMARAMIIMSSVPVRTTGFFENVTTSAMPMTAPGMMYGTMESVSTRLVITLLRRTTR